MTRARRDRSAGRSRSRRGSVYVLVLASAATLALIGLAAATITRTQIRTDGLDRDTQRASRLAVSAAHAAIAWINQTPDWRERLVDAADNGRTPDYGHFKLTAEAGGAECKWWFDDGNGGPINPKTGEPVRVVGLGRSGSAQRVVTATLVTADGPTNPLLGYAIYSAADVLLKDAHVRDGPVGSNTSVTSERTVSAEIHAPLFILKGGTFSGSQVVPAPARALPAASGPSAPFDALAASAAVIPYALIPGDTLDKRTIGPGVNPFGAGHPEGLYRIAVPAGKNLVIRNSRLSATLIVELGAGAKLELRDGLLWSPAVSRLPALVARGAPKAEVWLTSKSNRTLSESSEKVNFNPSGVPFAGVTDADQTDVYPSHLVGLFAVLGGATVKIGTDSTILGCVIADGAITTDKLTMRADPALAAFPPLGFEATSSRMIVSPGSWRQVPFHDVEGLEPIAEAVADAGK